MRPRIRTLKPEIWQDEKVGDLSHGARLLYVGLITMADDEGRLRELPAAITGQVFPYDGVAPTKLSRWLKELSATGLVLRYGCGGKNYLAFRKWKKHQRVDKPNESDLPPPPENSPNGSGTDPGNDRGSISDAIADQSRPPRARVSGPIPSDPVSPSHKESKLRREPSKRADPHVLPEMGEDLARSASLALPILAVIQRERGGDVPTLRGVGLAVRRFPDRDHWGIAAELEHWALAGRGQGRPVKDWVRTYATFLERAPAGSAVRKSDGQVIPLRDPALERMDAWKRGYSPEAS